jgi:hypothetical protein
MLQDGHIVPEKPQFFPSENITTPGWKRAGNVQGLRAKPALQAMEHEAHVVTPELQHGIPMG